MGKLFFYGISPCKDLRSHGTQENPRPYRKQRSTQKRENVGVQSVRWYWKPPLLSRVQKNKGEKWWRKTGSIDAYNENVDKKWDVFQTTGGASEWHIPLYIKNKSPNTKKQYPYLVECRQTCLKNCHTRVVSSRYEDSIALENKTYKSIWTPIVPGDQKSSAPIILVLCSLRSATSRAETARAIPAIEVSAASTAPSMVGSMVSDAFMFYFPGIDLITEDDTGMQFPSRFACTSTR